MKLLLISTFILVSVLIYGQNQHLTIGVYDAGICLGNSKAHAGIRINWVDKNVSCLNGINIAGVTKAKKSNGFTFGLIANHDSIINGIAINGLVGESYKTNGIVISGIGYGASVINGIGIGGLAMVGDTMNDFFISLFGMTYWNTEVIKRINGIAIGLVIGSNTEKMNGLTLSLFNNVSDTLNGVAIAVLNSTKELHGVQIGLWNVAENNRFFKKMPFMNVNFRKRKKAKR